jgi:hypothetical protein
MKPRTLLTLACFLLPSISLVAGEPLQPTIAALLKRSDPSFTTPLDRAMQGIPIGNGAMGTMVWTPLDEGGLAFQINRVDAWSASNISGEGPYYTNSLPSLARLIVRSAVPLQQGMKSYAASLNMADATADVVVNAEKGTFESSSFISATRPVLVTELKDTRPGAKGFTVGVGQWRIPLDADLVATMKKSYSAPKFPGLGPKAEIFDDCAVVSEVFQNKDHYLKYAVVVGAIAGKVSVRQEEPRSAWLDLTPGDKGGVVVLTATAVSDDPAVDAAEVARKEFVAARDAGIATLRSEHQEWWTGFWNGLGTYVSLDSADGLANYLESIWFANLYQTAITSRGVCPPKFNGSVFLADRDYRCWGGQFWLWNTEGMYFPLFAQNAMSLIDPFYNMYWRNLPSAKQDAKDLWNAEGAWYPEGCMYYQKVVERTPEQVVAEQAKRLGDKAVFSHISHLLSGTAEVAWMFYKRYNYTGDVEWLRNRAYPLLKETAAFYMSYFKKGEDGFYFIYPTNAHEAYKGVKNGMMDLAAVRWLMPRLIQASETLGVDADMRPRWKEFLENQPPYPTMDMPGAKELYADFPDDTYAPGLLGAVKGRHNGEAVRVTPTWPFENIGTGISKPEELERMRRTLLSEIFGNPDVWMGYPSWSRTPIMAARLGMKEHLAKLLIRSAVNCRQQRMFVGLDHEIGLVRGEVSQLASAAVNEAMLQSHNGLIQIFTALPQAWNARFRLLAEGDILVEGESKDGVVGFVVLEPRRDAEVALVNPWPGQKVTMKSGKETKILDGERIPLKLAKGERYLLSPESGAVATIPDLIVNPEKSMRFQWRPDPKKDALNERYLGMLGAPLPHEPAEIEVGPFSPKSAEEMDAQFLLNVGDGRFGLNVPVPNLITWSPEHGGSINFLFPEKKLGKRYFALVAEKGKDESLLLKDFDVSADFFPQQSPFMGFFFKQQNHYGSGVYYAAIGSAKTGGNQTVMCFGQQGIDVNLNGSMLRSIPLEFPLENGVGYRLKMSVRQVKGLPMRYADVTLQVSKATAPDTILAKGEMRLNLSNDNMPDLGQAGIYVNAAYPDPAGDQSVLANNFQLKAIP